MAAPTQLPHSSAPGPGIHTAHGPLTTPDPRLTGGGGAIHSAERVPVGAEIPLRAPEVLVPHVVDFTDVSTEGLESSPFAAALAGLRANEARYFSNKYKHEFVVEPADEAAAAIEWVSRILREERDIIIESPPLQACEFVAEGTRFAYVFYESGLAINVMYGLAEGGKRAVGFKLSDGMPIPGELESRFKFARQRSKLAGTIRGSYFVIKGAY
jgi:hypothetical protein